LVIGIGLPLERHAATRIVMLRHWTIHTLLPAGNITMPPKILAAVTLCYATSLIHWAAATTYCRHNTAFHAIAVRLLRPLPYTRHTQPPRFKHCIDTLQAGEGIVTPRLATHIMRQRARPLLRQYIAALAIAAGWPHAIT